jgi:hypothetical protein
VRAGALKRFSARRASACVRCGGDEWL